MKKYLINKKTKKLLFKSENKKDLEYDKRY